MAVNKRDSVYAQQVVDCFLVLALQGVTEAEANIDYALLVLKFAIEYASMGELIQSCKNTLMQTLLY